MNEAEIQHVPASGDNGTEPALPKITLPADVIEHREEFRTNDYL